LLFSVIFWVGRGSSGSYPPVCCCPCFGPFFISFFLFLFPRSLLSRARKPDEGTQKALNARLFCYNLRRLLEIVCKLFSQKAGTNDRRFGSSDQRAGFWIRFRVSSLGSWTLWICRLGCRLLTARW